MRKVISFLILIFISVQLSAQKVNYTNKGDDLRLSVLPYYNYGNGIGMTSPDSLFQINIRFRMQNRATYIKSEANDRISAEVRRLRLRLDGYVGNPKFMYTIQLSFSPGDTGGEIIGGENLQVIRDAVIFYQPNKNWTLSFGQTKLPGNRQRLNSSGALQFTDRSINNAMFTIDRDFGVQVHYLNKRKNMFSYNFRGAISTGEGRNELNNFDTGLAYTGKVELFPFGVFVNQGDFFEGDLVREETPKLLLSGAYSFNKSSSKTQGQLGRFLFDKRDVSSLFLDAMLKYKGWSFQSAYMNRISDDPITFNPDDLTDLSFVYAGEGIDYQLSYLFKSNYEILGRYSFQKTDSKIAHLAPNQDQYSIGLTKYFWEHAFKMQVELTYNEYDNLFGMTKNDWYVRFQIEMGI